MFDNTSNNIFGLIYRTKGISKQEIARSLDMSLPTVSKRLQELELNNIIVKSIPSSMHKIGRPNAIYQCNELAAVSIAVKLLPDFFEIAVIDLYYQINKIKKCKISFKDNEEYYSALCAEINAFIEESGFGKVQILGVDFAIPGILSEDNKSVLFSEVLKTRNLNLKSIESKIDFPCSFMHDAEAASIGESIIADKTDSALYLFLNSYIGSSLILDGRLIKTKYLSSGTMEHIIIHENGEQCYCGKKGCVDSYCSVNSLLKFSGYDDVETFFIDLRSGVDAARRCWEEYLTNLSLAIDNMRMVIGCDVVIAGILRKYITEEDIDFIRNKVQRITAFKNAPFNLIRGVCDKPSLRGAAYSRIMEFLNTQ